MDRTMKTATRIVWTPDRLKKLRKRFGETQEQFAKRFRISFYTLRFWEQGQGEPSGPVTVLLEQLDAAGPPTDET